MAHTSKNITKTTTKFVIKITDFAITWAMSLGAPIGVSYRGYANAIKDCGSQRRWAAGRCAAGVLRL